MDIKEIQAKKTEMQSKILTLLKQFELETGTKVKHILLNNRGVGFFGSAPQKPVLLGVEARVEIF